MPSVQDAAAAVLQRTGQITAMKLQKLVYYAQAWSLVWDEEPLFDERIEAWANGPVVRELYNEHRGMYTVGPDWTSGDPNALSQDQQETVDIVVGQYGKHSAQWLSELTHMEDPWREARAGLGVAERGTREITLDSMAEYYSALTEQGETV
jgi:uncharacterized phage-associated protein